MPARTKYLTVSEVADRMSVSAATVRRWIRDGRLEAIDIREGEERRSKEYRISPEALRAYVAARRTVSGEGSDGAGDRPDATAS